MALRKPIIELFFTIPIVKVGDAREVIELFLMSNVERIKVRGGYDGFGVAETPYTFRKRTRWEAMKHNLEQDTLKFRN